MPPDRRLAALVANEEATACVRRVADALAAFHATAMRGSEIDDAARLGAVTELWGRQFDELADVAGAQPMAEPIARLAPRGRRFLSGRHALFDARIAEGRVCDGHGDLLADDVFCLHDGPRILDCLEFDDRLRYGDVLADVAFLAMDLERLGRADLAQVLLDEYRAKTRDAWPSSLAHYYVAYRAVVRLKVAALRNDGAGASVHLDLAVRHLELGRIRLVLVGGPPGSGKSTLAEGIARATGFDLLHSDETRKRLAGLAPTTPAPARVGEGIYDEDWTARTYDALCATARTRLEHGQSVVLDASWRDIGMRAQASRVAEETASDLIVLRCAAPLDVTLRRVAERQVAGGGTSDANEQIARALAADVAPWPEATVIDTSTTARAALASALRAIGPT
jgi:predicted kinase